MKKVFTILAGIALSVGAMAQQLPNGGFETWTTTLNPDSWGTIASAFGSPSYSYFATKDTTTGNHVEGLASLKLHTDTVTAGTLITVPGQAGLGTAVYAQGISFTGVPYTKRIDTMYLSYKYTPATATDTALMGLNLSKNGTSLFGGELDLGISTTGGQWANVYLPLSKNDTSSGNNYYITGQNPDTLKLFFYASLDTGSHSFGSSLWVDGIRFDAAVNVVGPNGIANLNGNVFGVNAYPNPANNSLNIAVEQDEVGALFQLFDVAGREVYTSTIASGKFAIDTKNFESGVYSIRVISTDKMTTYKGKISIAH